MAYTGDQKRAYQLAWIKARRDAWIESKGGRCARCGSTDSLEVDHIDRRTKSLTPAAVWSRREEIREAELAKCQVLCEECHRKKSSAESHDWLGTSEHGTHNYYVKYSCRCVPCTEAHARLAKETRAAGKKW